MNRLTVTHERIRVYLKDFSNSSTRLRFPFTVNLECSRSQSIICTDFIRSNTNKTIENLRFLIGRRKILALANFGKVLQTIETSSESFSKILFV